MRMTKMRNGMRPNKFNQRGVIDQMKGLICCKDWGHTYFDNGIRPIVLLDSHQIGANGKKLGKYNTLVPCRAFVLANELADKACSVYLQHPKDKNVDVHPLAKLPSPANIRFPSE